MEDLPVRARRWAEAVLGTGIVDARRLAGGLDALTLRCGLADGRTVVLRLLPDPEVAMRQPVTVDAALLAALAGRGLPIPAVLGSDVSGADAGCPGLVLSWIDGVPGVAPFDPVDGARQVAAVLDHVHALDPAPLAWLRRSTGERVLGEPWAGLREEPLGDALWAGLRAALPPADRPLVPIHGDPWIGNTVWRGSTLAGLIDWSDACLSDPAADLGLVRLDVAIAVEPQAVAQVGGAEHQLFWDLWGLTVWLANADEWTPPLLELGFPLDAEGVRGRLRDYAGFLLG